MPACAAMTDALAARLQGASSCSCDGTLWVDDEMVRDGVGVKTGKRMGHMSVSGEDGTMAAFERSSVQRKVFIHINTTNPILLDDSPERARGRWPRLGGLPRRYGPRGVTARDPRCAS